MTVKRFRRKPEPKKTLDDLIAARYYFGEPLDDLAQVAANAMDGEVAECTLPTETVLLARYISENGPDWCYTVVRSGRWLGFSYGYGNLFEESDGSIAQWYEPAEGNTP